MKHFFSNHENLSYYFLPPTGKYSLKSTSEEHCISVVAGGTCGYEAMSDRVIPISHIVGSDG